MQLPKAISLISSVGFALAGPLQAEIPVIKEFIRVGNGLNGTDKGLGHVERGLIDKRVVGGIYLCTAINWGGECGFAVQPINTCIGLNAPWYHTLSSFGPDPGTYMEFYSDQSCKNALKRGMTNPGSADLRNQGMNDLIGSFIARNTPLLSGPPGNGGAFDPNVHIDCQAGRQYDVNERCNAQMYCVYTRNNLGCTFSGGDYNLPGFTECANDWGCPGSNRKCINELCCNLDEVPNEGSCPRKDQVDACCFQRTVAYQSGVGGGAYWRWLMQSNLPAALKCGC